MSRRLILAICLLGTIGGAAGTALAASPVSTRPHQVCVVLYQDNAPSKDFCVDYSAVQH